MNWPAGIGSTSSAVKLGIGSAGVLGRLNTLFESVDSLRAEPRSQPFWTNDSTPSGRTSETVTCRSTSGVDERTHTVTAPVPSTVVSDASGGVRYDTALPAGFGCQFHSHSSALAHRPPPPVSSP